MGDRGNIKDVEQLEENQDNKSRGMPGSSAYAGRKLAQSSSIKVHGITEEQEQSDDLGKISGTELWESRVLVQRVLCRHRGKECTEDAGVNQASDGRG